MLVDIRVLELLASKICHDLVSPVGAINNGVELIEDIGGHVVDEAMQLIGNSAVQASRRLRVFRMAYGRAGSEGHLSFKDVRETIEAHFEGTKIKPIFAPDFPQESFVETRGALKNLLNFALLAEEALIYGGEIAFGHGQGDFASGVTLTVTGRNALLTASALQALEGGLAIEAITPRTVHAYVTGRFLAMHGFGMAVESPKEDCLLLHYAKT